MLTRKMVRPIHLAVFGICIALASCKVLADEHRPSYAQDKIQRNFQAVLNLRVEIVNPREDSELNEFKSTFTKLLFQKWFAEMRRKSAPGEKGKVVVRFEIQRAGPKSAQAPAVEINSGKKVLQDADLAAVRDASKSVQFPGNFTGSTIAIRATFYHDVPVETGTTIPTEAPK